ncbi:MAG TPA: YbaB/EbfC family nucleoid-associated protein [Candidatus Acidoferrales bacterium]|nr:YbaB/EbfC family nucleoid-associated protein [Candidatus Acidoferrales bacterium]
MEVKALQQMLAQFSGLQERLEREIRDLRVEATSGAGMVSVKMDGQKRVMEVRIDPEIFAGKDAEMLGELILAAVNDASRRVDDELQNQLKGLVGGMPNLAGLKIPGLF